jgi:GH15 family glucan-1,4-alpha-glucosidase
MERSPGSRAVGRLDDDGCPPIADYALIGDGRSCALVSRSGSIDWCCLPRFDSGSLFGRLLDWESGGYCAFGLGPGAERRYLDRTMVLETTWGDGDAECRLLDFFAPPEDGDGGPRLIRILEGVRGSMELQVRIAPRFDYGAVAPWVRGRDGLFAAIGGDDGLLIRCDFELDFDGRHVLESGIELGEGERARLELGSRSPVELDSLSDLEPVDPDALDRCLDATVDWWRERAECIDPDLTRDFPGVLYSALTLRALTFDRTGAIAAAATTSLPEARRLSGERNWDYRYSWVRDSALAVRSLAELGCERDADAFRRFIERSAAGSAADLQILFGVGGERRLGEQEVESMEGWRGASPVRVGNQASGQLQLDAFGQLVDQSWRWHRRGNSPDHDYWIFVADLVEAAIEHWRLPDCGIWEWRGEPRHFVHSKALTWSALDRGIRLGEDCGKEVPERWREEREEIRASVEQNGYDEERGVFRMDYDHDDLDAALLRLPAAGFLSWEDERMVRTADAIREKLDLGGLLRRYDADDEMPEEGAFLACSFWLVHCLARQGRIDQARETYDRACSTANDVGLFSEEYDPEAERMLGNFPQALTHLSQIEAAIALGGGPDGD